MVNILIIILRKTNFAFKCSKTCGEGTKQRIVMCRDMNGNQSSQCDEKKRPLDQMTCNTDPCPIWNFGGWGQVRNGLEIYPKYFPSAL